MGTGKFQVLGFDQCLRYSGLAGFGRVVQKWCGRSGEASDKTDRHTRYTVRGERVEVGMSCCETRECGRCKTNKLFPSGRASGRKDEPNHRWIHREEVPQCLILELQPRFSSGDAAHSRAADRRTAVGCGNAIEARPVPESFSITLIPVSPVTNSARVRFSLPIVLSSLVTLWAVLECSLMREKTCLTDHLLGPALLSGGRTIGLSFSDAAFFPGDEWASTTLDGQFGRNQQKMDTVYIIGSTEMRAINRAEKESTSRKLRGGRYR
ncbi:hypothetical protein BDP67DRAFT_81105 [Colletotrichum lupini]|nr:hypothetical protein BDP67DRAFT_81105 [Colletotrichum lupini]